MKRLLLPLVCFLSLNIKAQVSKYTVASPDKNIVVSLVSEPKRFSYKIDYNGEEVLKKSKLGLLTEDEDFANNLRVVSASAQTKVEDRYELFTGKRKINNYLANKLIIHLQNNNEKKLDIIFQVSNDGVAFRYYFPGNTADVKTIKEEFTSFHFDISARAFLQPMQIAKTGWQKSNPAYEEHYKQNILVTDTSTFGAGWVYPALFHYKNTWVLITESSLDSNYCGTRLQSNSPAGEYKVGFPDAREVFTGQGYLPHSKLPFYSPWRVVTIGSLKTIID